MSKTIFVLGATSAIAQASCRTWAEQGCSFHLTARSEDALLILKDDLLTRGAGSVTWALLTEEDLTNPKILWHDVKKTRGPIDTVFIAQGMLGHQEESETNHDHFLMLFKINFLMIAELLHEIALDFMKQKNGSIIVISSVAGVRGRQSNYSYGTAKAALTTFLSGLRQRLYPFGIHVMTVLPGFVDTPMTKSVPKNPLFASAETVGYGIVKAEAKGKDIVYLPFFWWGIMTLIKLIPEWIFKRLKI